MELPFSAVESISLAELDMSDVLLAISREAWDISSDAVDTWMVLSTCAVAPLASCSALALNW
jgi:hypothetical protein